MIQGQLAKQLLGFCYYITSTRVLYNNDFKSILKRTDGPLLGVLPYRTIYYTFIAHAALQSQPQSHSLTVAQSHRHSL